MKKRKRHTSQNESLRPKWKRRIIFEKRHTESCAEWMAERLEALLDHMLYGHAAVTYRKQDGSLQMVKATLIHYETEFRKKYDPMAVEGAVVYRNVNKQRWITFQAENFTEWRSTIWIGCHRLHGLLQMNHFYFEESSESVFGNPG